MDFWDRLRAFPEVLLPLWGLRGKAREKDIFPQQKAGFWGGVLSESAPLASRVAIRTEVPPNIRRAHHLVATAEEASAIAADIVQDDLEPKIESYGKSPTGNIRGTREVIPPGDLEGKMEEVTPQMTLRPIPRVEKEPEDELPLEHTKGISTREAEDAQEAAKDALLPTRPEFAPVINMEILLAHRRFHQRLLHHTDWSEHLGADIQDDESGPSWKTRSWVGWDPLLDPIPHEERAPGSGFLGDDDMPIPLD